MSARWSSPPAGDIVWCMFPYLPDLASGRKPRPVLVVKIFDDEAPGYGVLIPYGTSQKVAILLAGEFAIRTKPIKPLIVWPQ